ncbi:MAG TPA: hypothetical protein PKJ10_06540 [Smithella sp.]|nr:hypothetical protein [Smithella sp.]
MSNFPFVHLLVLLIGGIILVVLKKKYQKIRTSELIIIFILIFILVAIFTDTGIDLAKSLIDLIQVD